MLKRTLLISALFMATFFILVSCNKSDESTIDQGFSYYPLETGHYVRYSVDSFYFSATNYPTIRIDTIHYEIKELIDSSFLDNEGRTAYRIERYRRPDSTANWAIDRIWSATNNQLILDKNEDDIHYIRLVFPMSLHRTWKGNALINPVDDNVYLKDWEYTYSELNQPFSIGSTSFDSTLLVTQIDEENLIEKKFAYERYAKGVGMISKEIKFLGKQHDLSNGWDYPETGIWVRYVYLAAGQE